VARSRLARALRDLVRAPRSEQSNAVVLLYHRVGTAALDPQLLGIAPENFADHLRLIHDHYVPISLTDLVSAAARGGVPARAVALTFDDGYSDNLSTAKPLLEDSGTPATVFAVSGYVHGGGRFWWDELERLLLWPGHLPPALALEIGRDVLAWELGEDSEYTPARAEARSGWTVLDDADPGMRQRIYRELCARLRVVDEPEREGMLEQLRAVVRHNAEAEMPRSLNAEELARLADGDLIDVGAHTVTHPSLSNLPSGRQRDEIVRSKHELEEVVGRRVASFAYPYGTTADFDETTVSLTRAAGFDHACANVAGRMGSRTDRFRLPRFLVRNWDADELDRHLAALVP
jgi:peptidoglycan/xylan/chitin deacetylase (PgdA/CDA1 family)